MKLKLACLLLIWTVTLIPAADPVVTEKGLHHRVWERSVPQQDHLGRVTERKSSYTELATGLMYEENGELLESSEVIELFRDGAAARKGQHKVIFPANLNAPDGIDYESIDKKRFQSQLLGLSYYEVTTGRSALIAEIKDCQGFLHPPNRVVYSDALSDIRAEVRYTYRLDRFAQDVILFESPPSPEEYGLNPAACRLEIFTEFGEVVEPTRKTRLRLPPARLGQPEVIDEELEFGQMRIGTGKAFVEDKPGSVNVGKLWTVIDGRQFLVESVDYLSTKKLLDTLPAAGVAAVQKARTQRVAVRNGRAVPGKRQAQVKSKPIQMAKAEVEINGPRLVLDYEIINSSQTDYRFRADKTYYISANVGMSGNTYFEGGAIVKFTNVNASVTAYSSAAGTTTFETQAYRPVVFTSMHDNTIGESIASSTGNPTTNYCGSYYLVISGQLGSSSYGVLVNNVRFAHAERALRVYYGSGHVVRNAQFVRCRVGLEPDVSDVTLQNVLFHNVLTNAHTIYDAGVAYMEHVTVHNAAELFGGGGDLSVQATNSLFVGVTNMNTFTSINNATNSDPSVTFQAVGGGSSYLASGSAYRNAGTTNVNATLLLELRKKTTYPPLVLSNMISLNTTLSPNAQRDTDVPDIGYHYDPIDYALGSCIVTNATLTLTNGVAIATFDQSSIVIYDNGQLVSHGRPERRNQICRYNTVQEQSTNWGNGAVNSHTQVLGYQWGSTTPAARFRFTDFSEHAGGGYHLYTADSQFLIDSLVVRDCNFNSGTVIFAGSEAGRLGVTNNLFHRVNVDFVYYPSLGLYNNLFKGSDCYFEPYASSNTWTIKDNSFDNTTIYQEGSLVNSNNAYINCSGRLTPNAANDVVTNSFTYHIGPLGNYYQPTNSALVNKGSITNAALAGLYHFTTATNALKEANSIVDIGLHYVAANYATGVPEDYDGDGWGDWFEDINGNGTYDSGIGESDWQTYNSMYGVGSGPGLQVFTPLK